MPDEEEGGAEVEENPVIEQGEDQAYPSAIFQDEVGQPLLRGNNTNANDAPLIANERNVLARRCFPPGFGINAASVHDDGLSDDEDCDMSPPSVDEWDTMFMSSYFNVMAFIFKLNAVRLDQQQLPKAIAVLVLLLLVVSLYVAHIIVGGMMIYVSQKYRGKPCEENLEGWLLVMGVYICASAAVTVASGVFAIVVKKDLLAICRNLGGIFALVWFIMGCVRVYKIDKDKHICNDVLFDFSYYWITITLIFFSSLCCFGCCGGIAVAVTHAGGPPDDDL